MEIINNNNSGERPKKDVAAARNLYIGIILALIGVVWMAYNFGGITRTVFYHIISWQMLLVALGGYFMVIRKWIPGLILFISGVVFAAGEWMHLYIPLDKVILPLILIGAGIAVAVQKK